MRFYILPELLAIVVTVNAAASTVSLQVSGPPGEFITLGQSYSLNNGSLIVTPLPPAGTVAFAGFSGGHSWGLTLAPYPGTRLDPGVYANAARWPFQSQQPGLDFDLDSRGCNQLSGSFTVLSSSYSAGGTLLALHATFEQHCENSPQAATGEFNFVSNAAIPAVSPALLLVLGVSLALIGARLLR
jgi:hypothetical protein